MGFSTILKAGGAGVRVCSKFVVKHLPTILTAVGTVGVIVGTVLAAKKAPEAQEEFVKEKEKWEKMTPEEKEEHGKAEYVFRIAKVGARYYGLVCLVVGGSIVCFWVANHINLKRTAAAVAGLKVVSDQLTDEEGKFKEKFGKKEVDKAKDELNAEKNKDIKVDPEMAAKLNRTIGECVCWDPIMKHPFTSSAEAIRRAIRMVKDELRQQIIDGDKYAFVPYSDFLCWAGCEVRGPSYDTDAGQYLGFGVNVTERSVGNLDELIDDAVDVSWTSDMLEGEIPVLALKYGNPPKYAYFKS